MVLKELQRLTGELEELSDLLKQETRTPARWIIMHRIREIIHLIGEKSGG